MGCKNHPSEIGIPMELTPYRKGNGKTPGGHILVSRIERSELGIFYDLVRALG